MPTILMCRPDHYGVLYSINPWMHPEFPEADTSGAPAEWARLAATLRELGAAVAEIPGEPGVPDLVFTANAGLVRGRAALLSRFRFPQRRPEEDVFRRWFAANGFAVIDPPPGACFEGAGDALFAGDTLWCGHGFRSDPLAAWAGAALGVRAVNARLVDPRFYHLDTCFCPLDGRDALAFPGAFDAETLAAMRAELDLIEVNEAEAARFACNAVLVNGTVVMPAGSPNARRALEGRGYAVREVPMGAFIQSGGACKCLTLRV